MSTVYTRRFAAQVINTSGNHVIFTADDLHVYILRDILLVNQATVELNISLFIQAGLNAYSIFIGILPTKGTMRFDGRQEILPSEQLVATILGGQASVLVTGYALTPPG